MMSKDTIEISTLMSSKDSSCFKFDTRSKSDNISLRSSEMRFRPENLNQLGYTKANYTNSIKLDSTTGKSNYVPPGYYDIMAPSSTARSERKQNQSTFSSKERSELLAKLRKLENREVLYKKELKRVEGEYERMRDCVINSKDTNISTINSAGIGSGGPIASGRLSAFEKVVEQLAKKTKLLEQSEKERQQLTLENRELRFRLFELNEVLEIIREEKRNGRNRKQSTSRNRHCRKRSLKHKHPSSLRKSKSRRNDKKGGDRKRKSSQSSSSSSSHGDRTRSESDSSEGSESSRNGSAKSSSSSDDALWRRHKKKTKKSKKEKTPKERTPNAKIPKVKTPSNPNMNESGEPQSENMISCVFESIDFATGKGFQGLQQNSNYPTSVKQKGELESPMKGNTIRSVPPTRDSELEDVFLRNSCVYDPGQLERSAILFRSAYVDKTPGMKDKTPTSRQEKTPGMKDTLGLEKTPEKQVENQGRNLNVDGVKLENQDNGERRDLNVKMEILKDDVDTDSSPSDFDIQDIVREIIGECNESDRNDIDIPSDGGVDTTANGANRLITTDSGGKNVNDGKTDISPVKTIVTMKTESFLDDLNAIAYLDQSQSQSELGKTQIESQCDSQLDQTDISDILNNDLKNDIFMNAGLVPSGSSATSIRDPTPSISATTSATSTSTNVVPPSKKTQNKNDIKEILLRNRRDLDRGSFLDKCSKLGMSSNSEKKASKESIMVASVKDSSKETSTILKTGGTQRDLLLTTKSSKPESKYAHVKSKIGILAQSESKAPGDSKSSLTTESPPLASELHSDMVNYFDSIEKDLEDLEKDV